MQTRNRNIFTTIHTEGALLPVDLLQRISENDKNLEGLNPESYHLAPGEKLNEAINRSWNRLNGLWGAFKSVRSQLEAADPGIGVTRERWLLPLFQELGYGRLVTAKAIEIEGKSYPISHIWSIIPIHLVGCQVELDKRAPGVAGAARVSPHSLVQEYLNRADDAQWGLLSNGLLLRVLRDNAALTRQAYLEFDLESMFDGEVYSDFVLLWLVCHQSRFEIPEKQTDCILERWSKSAQEHGTRALDNLRNGVKDAIVSLGQGFLLHPLNGELRNRLKNGDLSSQDYYRQLLRLVYRLIFLFAAEDRDLLLLPDAQTEAKERYRRYYSTARLRTLAERQRGSRHHDRYEALRLVMTLLGSDKGCPELAIPALGGFLFDARSTADLNDAKLDNQAFFHAVRSLAFITEGNTRRVVDYRNLGPEELGSVYESLLELHPQLNSDAGTFKLESAAGNERKTTGSYYTPTSLIQVLLDSALDPVIEDRLKGKPGAAQQEQALLDIKVCDPACGSGHFLIAAAYRIAGRLAEVRTSGEEPSPNETRRALRDVIQHCIYGVDINPMAVELSKVNLWLESLEPGKPLSFLDAHIQCGNSLIGVGPKMDLHELEVPNKAFNPVTGDDRATASLLKKRNNQERQGRESLFVTVINTREDLDKWLAERTRALEAMPEDSAEQVQAKENAYLQVSQSAEYRRQKQIADLWTAAFFWKIQKFQDATYEISAPTHGQLRRLREGQSVQTGLLEAVEALGKTMKFFHWPLEFAEVSAQGGFDCVLGNPPWERIKLQEEEFFSWRDPQIAAAPNKAARQRLIDQLNLADPTLAKEFQDAKHAAECTSKFVRESKRFPLAALGDVNTYALFAEHFRALMNGRGHAGVIVPTGIATDDTTKDFFGDLVEKRSLASLFDFENKEAIFPGVHRSYKFCLLTLSGTPVKQAQFVFFATRVEHLRDERRRFSLDPAEIALFNPNTRTMPVFRTRADMELTRAIYQRVPVLVNEHTGENPWGVSFLAMFHMSNDSGLFITEPREGYVRLYEAKMIWVLDHRYGDFKGATQANLNQGTLPQVSLKNKKNPNFYISTRYYVSQQEISNRLAFTDQNWLLAFRDITNSVSERTAIFSIIPKVGVGNNLPLIFLGNNHKDFSPLILGCLTSLVFDFVVRQKIAGLHMNFFFVKQLPVLPPSEYHQPDLGFVKPRILELVYTSYDLKSFAEAMSYHGEPFPWDEDRRAVLRAELDAYYARLYGLNRKQLRYILDPADLTPRELEDILDPWEEVADPLDPSGYDARRTASDFPGETFRVLKEKEFKQFGEYRTRRLVLEAWERIQKEKEAEEVSRPIPIDLPITVKTPQPIYTDAWVPFQMTPYVSPESLSVNFRQAVGVAWELENFGKANSIPLYDAQKFSYFIQRAGLADLEIDYREFARGPYSPQVTYKAGAYAKNKSFWEVRGNNVVRGRKLKDAVAAAPRVFVDVERAQLLIQRLAQLSKDDLGRLATVDFASRAIFERGQHITPENLRGYFQSDWPEKVSDTWYTNENILWALEMLADIGLFQKLSSNNTQSPAIEETKPLEIHKDIKEQTNTIEQPTLSDFGVYKCEVCGKMVMGFEKSNHEQEKHGGKGVGWKKVR